MTIEEIEERLKTRYPQIKEIINELKQMKYFESPASTKYHLSEKGGLFRHSLNVIEIGLEINKVMRNVCREEDIIIAGLLHDVGKAGIFEKIRYIEKDGKYLYNSKVKIVTRDASLYFAGKWNLPENVTEAILLHDGMWEEGNKKYGFNFDPLTLIIMTADLLAAGIRERK